MPAKLPSPSAGSEPQAGPDGAHHVGAAVRRHRFGRRLGRRGVGSAVAAGHRARGVVVVAAAGGGDEGQGGDRGHGGVRAREWVLIGVGPFGGFTWTARGFTRTITTIW